MKDEERAKSKGIDIGYQCRIKLKRKVKPGTVIFVEGVMLYEKKVFRKTMIFDLVNENTGNIPLHINVVWGK